MTVPQMSNLTAYQLDSTQAALPYDQHSTLHARSASKTPDLAPISLAIATSASPSSSTTNAHLDSNSWSCHRSVRCQCFFLCCASQLSVADICACLPLLALCSLSGHCQLRSHFHSRLFRRSIAGCIWMQSCACTSAIVWETQHGNLYWTYL